MVMTELLEGAPTTMTIQQAKNIREAGTSNKFSRETVISIMLHKEESKRQVKIGAMKLRDYFSEDYTIEEIEDIIFDLLEQWKGDVAK